MVSGAGNLTHVHETAADIAALGGPPGLRATRRGPRWRCGPGFRPLRARREGRSDLRLKSINLTTVLFGLVSLGMVIAAASWAAVLESPADGSVLSGIGFISGWKCDAGRITVAIDDGDPLAVAMRQERSGLPEAGECGGTTDHGFVMWINWALLGDGEHVVVAYDDGVAFARSTFTVGTTGEAFLEGVSRRTVVDDFPEPGQRTLLEWNESTQHFEIAAVWGEALAGYDRAYWRQYDADAAAGTYRTGTYLYAQEPDVAACSAGRLTQGARNRALEAANQIRALHGLPPVRWNSSYSRQAQEAALIQAANNFLRHQPGPDVACYSEEGATGSGTGNLSAFSVNGSGVLADPAADMINWTHDATNVSVLAAAGHRRWVLSPFSHWFAYGQVEGFSVHKAFGYRRDPVGKAEIEVDYVAFPYEIYPFHLLDGDPPWSFSAVADKASFWNNRGDYFRNAAVTVTRVADDESLPVTDRYTDTRAYGLPNFLSWQVDGWEYDTLYEVEIDNVVLGGGERWRYVYAVFVERDGLIADRPE